MSALSPAPAPTSGVRWTDLPTPLDSALPSCCLSYKQSALLPPLCFHNLTNPFSRKPFGFTSMQNARGWALSFPGGALCLSVPGCPGPVGVANSMLSAACSLFFSLGSLFRARLVCFQILAASFRKTPGVGVSIPIRSLDSWQGVDEHSQCRRCFYGTRGGELSRRSDIQTLRRSDVLSVRLGSRSNA